MYYDSRSKLYYFGESWGDMTTVVDYYPPHAGGARYESTYGSAPGNQSYTQLEEEKIVDYDLSQSGRHTAYSGVFPSKYGQSYKPVKHFWRWIDIKPGTGIYRKWDSAIRLEEFEHSGRLSPDIVYWGKPERQVDKMGDLPYPTRHSYKSALLSWSSVKSKAAANVPELLNDNKLLNLEQVDVATFLAEIRDVRNLADLVKFKSHHTEVSNKFLGVNFGVLPMVSDIAKMYDNVQNLNPAIKSWNDMVDSSQVRAYHKQIRKDEQEGVTTYKPGNLGGIINHSYEYEYHWKQKYTELAHAYVRPKSLADNTDLSLQASLWGLDKPLRTVWNIIPMSFAVDWVFNVGDIIDDLEHREPNLEFDIEGAGASCKLETSITTKVYIHIKGERHYIGESHVEDSEYYRAPMPISDVFNHLKDKPIGPLEFTPELSGFQLTLSAALAHQKIFKF